MGVERLPDRLDDGARWHGDDEVERRGRARQQLLSVRRHGQRRALYLSRSAAWHTARGALHSRHGTLHRPRSDVPKTAAGSGTQMASACPGEGSGGPGLRHAGPVRHIGAENERLRATRSQSAVRRPALSQPERARWHRAVLRLGRLFVTGCARASPRRSAKSSVETTQKRSLAPVFPRFAALRTKDACGRELWRAISSRSFERCRSRRGRAGDARREPGAVFHRRRGPGRTLRSGASALMSCDPLTLENLEAPSEFRSNAAGQAAGCTALTTVSPATFHMRRPAGAALLPSSRAVG